MSWIEAGRYLQKDAFNWTLDTKNINTLRAVLEARMDNNNITEGDVIVGEGKTRAVKLNYIPPTCEDDGDADDSVCDGGTAIPPAQEWFEIKQSTYSQVYQIPFDDLRYVNNAYTFSEQALNTFRSVFPTVRQKLSADIAALLVANVGILPNGYSDMNVAIMDATTAGMNPLGFYQIARQYANSGYIGNTYIIGGTQVDNWQCSEQLATANTTIGIDMARARPAGNLYYDDLIGTQSFADGSKEHIVSFDANMLKFVSYSQNAGIFSTDVLGYTPEQATAVVDRMFASGSNLRVMGGIIDPRTGLLWDLDILYVPCDPTTNKPVWNVQWSLQWDIYFMPPRICNLQGVNSIFHFTTCLEQAPICGNNPYPSTPTAQQYDFNTSGTITYPVVLQKVDIYSSADADAAPQTIYNIPNDPLSIANTSDLADFLNANQGQIIFSDAGTTLSYDGFTAIKIVINDTLTMQFA